MLVELLARKRLGTLWAKYPSRLYRGTHREAEPAAAPAGHGAGAAFAEALEERTPEFWELRRSGLA